MNKIKFPLLIFSLSVVFVLSGCSFKKAGTLTPVNNDSGQGEATGKVLDNNENKQEGGIRKFSDYNEIKSFISEKNEIGIAQIGMNLGLGSMERMTAAPMYDSGGIAKTAATEYSTTNVQVEEVDEADIIKNDGKYIYALAGKTLFIVDAYPPEKAEIKSKIIFDSRPQEIYIKGDRLAVYGYDESFYGTELYRSFIRPSQYIFIKIYDISDRANPKIVRDLNLEGQLSSSRMIGDYIYLVANYSIGGYHEDPLPVLMENKKALPTDCQEAGCFHPDVFYFDIPYERFNMVTLLALNISDENMAVTSQVYLMPGSDNVYASKDYLYLSYTKYFDEFSFIANATKDILYDRIGEDRQKKIAKIENVGSDILSESEKTFKILSVLQSYMFSLSEEGISAIEEEVDAGIKERYKKVKDQLEQTVIHKISLNKNQLEYKGKGEVKGHLLNQFSMDEADGYLRVATTRSADRSSYNDQPDESYNNLYVLDERMEQAGALEGMAKDERIYSVRFQGTRAYLVTFKQTDPLFVIDLTYPTSPKVLGELKIPGFSNYLHPYQDIYLIGIGKDAEANENGTVITKGLKVSLFDVSDINSPKVSDEIILGEKGSDSIALSDHRAVLVSEDKKLLVIPVSLVENSDGFNNRGLTFVGAAAFTIEGGKIVLRGKVDHSDKGTPAASDFWQGYRYYNNTVKRSLFMDDTLYTFSNNYLSMEDLEKLENINKIKLLKEN